MSVALVMSPLPVTVAAVSRFRSRTVPLMPMFRVEPVARSSTVTLLATPPPMPRKEAGERYKGRLLFSAGEKPYLSLRLKKGEDALRAARALVADYAAQLE